MHDRITRSRCRGALALAPMLLVAACASGYSAAPYDRAAAPGQTSTPHVGDAVSPALAGSRTDHVLVVSIDGLRPDAIERFGARTLLRLMAEGAYSLQASTILPSKTLPSHTSMLTGQEPDDHGVTWNSAQMDEHGHVATPTIFAAANGAGLATAAFFSKSKFEHLAVPGTLDHVQIPRTWPGKSSAQSTVDHVERYLRGARPNLLFVHLAEPDFAGHVFGWMSSPYAWAVRTADSQLAELLTAADGAFGAGNYTVIVTADHGGHGRDHGTDDPRDVTIPWIVWGESVEAGATLPEGIRTVDSAATALWLLGLEPAGAIAGRAVSAAFAPARAVAELTH